MAKPTYFKFFDGYMDTMRTCKTHKDRSILLMAMLDFWETGEVPVVPEHLQDKWRYLHNSLKASRTNAYVKLEENLEKTDQRITKNSNASSRIISKIGVDNQQVESNSYSRCKQDVSSYRIENREYGIKNNEYDSDSDSDSIKNKDHHHPIISCCLSDEEDKEAESLVIGDEKHITKTSNTSTYHQSSPSPSPSVLNIDNSKVGLRTDNLSTNSQPSTTNTEGVTVPSVNINSLSQSSAGAAASLNTNDEEVVRVSEQIYNRILERYFIEGRPVNYTYVRGQEELGVDKDLFYDAVDHLKALGKVKCELIKMADGKSVNSFLPQIERPTTYSVLDFSQYENYMKKDRLFSTILHYFGEHPFYVNPSWSIDEFLVCNKAVLEKAYAAIKDKVTGRPLFIRQCIAEYLLVGQDQYFDVFEESDEMKRIEALIEKAYS